MKTIEEDATLEQAMLYKRAHVDSRICHTGDEYTLRHNALIKCETGKAATITVRRLTGWYIEAHQCDHVEDGYCKFRDSDCKHVKGGKCQGGYKFRCQYANDADNCCKAGHDCQHYDKTPNRMANTCMAPDKGFLAIVLPYVDLNPVSPEGNKHVEWLPGFLCYVYDDTVSNLRFRWRLDQTYYDVWREGALKVYGKVRMVKND